MERSVNIEMILHVAESLGDLKDSVVFVGGAVLPLYLPKGTPITEFRITKDVDIVVQVYSAYELEKLREKLMTKGFHQSVEDDVMCRFRLDATIVDVMATDPISWAPGNQWFKEGYDGAQELPLMNTTVKIMPLPYWIASKMSAFDSRGARNVWASHDLEDLVLLWDCHPHWELTLAESSKLARDYIVQSIQKYLSSPRIMEAIQGNIVGFNSSARFDQVKTKMANLVKDHSAQ